jgi:sporulation protein YlmC with PRC-barrel domain
MLFSAARKHKVVSASTAGTVGKVASFVVDPGTRSVLAIKLKKTDDGDYLRWSDITAFGADAVTVTDVSKLGDADPDVKALSDKAHRLLGKRVLTSGGDELGELDDFDFDNESGVLTSLVVADGSEIPAERMLGVGSFAIVVREQA